MFAKRASSPPACGDETKRNTASKLTNALFMAIGKLFTRILGRY